MKYEYDYETLQLSEEQQAAMELGMGNIDALNMVLREIINERAAKGWEPLYPFSVPQVWFRKPKVTRRKKKTTKRS